MTDGLLFFFFAIVFSKMMAFDPLQCVRDSCEDVTRRATDVSIDDAKLKLLAEELAPNSSFNPFVAKALSRFHNNHEHRPFLSLPKQPVVEGL